MAMLNSTTAAAFLPQDYGKLIDLGIAEKSVASQVATVLATDKETMRLPVWVSDPSVGWTPENTEIALSDGATEEIVVVPSKVAGLVRISNEQADDTNPAVADLVGKSLVRQIAGSIDKAFFSATTANGPSGLASVAFSSIDTDGTYLNLDPFVDAQALAVSNSAELSHFVVAPDVATGLAKVKETTGSNRGLLESAGDGTLLAGIPMIVSPHVANGEVWGLDKTQVFTVIRKGSTVERDRSAAFSADATLVRGIARVGFGFPNPAGVIRLHNAA
ncbi:MULTISPECIES: phage major capsid protein [Rhodococcus]|uniref:phage major capsid protein n=1 Tax=Rhodococcus TaxID=1827 RepID=UPI001A1927C6|nr:MULTISPECIES: phage major capsid protein [Rhodococcus]MBJ7481630.1 phage major capsid protein [Rhodococcus sp. (in: high G+C Gram-positive bacteria)]MCT6732411.1 phage major capsid protein [Rhodococcus qingshengii]MDJ0432392.1 phage major capsid protein [Rhodococcus qingshengii]